MKKICILIFMLIGIAQMSYAQNTVAKLKYEQAEEAFNSGDYKTTLSRLEEVENMLGSINPKILYLRIQAQTKLVESNPLNDYNLLESLRENTAYYLKNYEKNSPEEKYKEVYLISDTLNKYPKTRAEFDAKLKLKKEEEEKQKKLAEEKLRLEQEAKEKAAKELELKKQYDNKYSGTVVSFHSGNIARYGLSIDYWDTQTLLGLGASLRCNFRGLSKLAPGYNYKELTDINFFKFDLAIVPNFPIYKRLRGYTSIGVSILDEVTTYEKYDNSGAYIKKVYYNRTEKAEPNFESGVGLILPVYKRLTVKGGLAWSNFKNREITFGVGLDLKKNK